MLIHIFKKKQINYVSKQFMVENFTSTRNYDIS